MSIIRAHGNGEARVQYIDPQEMTPLDCRAFLVGVRDDAERCQRNPQEVPLNIQRFTDLPFHMPHCHACPLATVGREWIIRYTTGRIRAIDRMISDAPLALVAATQATRGALDVHIGVKDLQDVILSYVTASVHTRGA